jgi:hypothetical protein
MLLKEIFGIVETALGDDSVSSQTKIDLVKAMHAAYSRGFSEGTSDYMNWFDRGYKFGIVDGELSTLEELS